MKHNYLKHLFTALLLLCATVATAHDFEVDGIYYNITNATNKTVAVTYKGNSFDSYANEYEGDVEIPESVTYNSTTYNVTSIGSYAFCFCIDLTGIVIPNSVTSIDNYAFYNCSGLTSAVIGNSVKSIGEWAFWKCSSLTSIVIPNSVTSIGDAAFIGCSGLTSIEIPNSVTSIGEMAFEDCSGLTSITVEYGNEVYDSRDNCNAIIETETNKLTVGCKNTVIPNSVTSIGNYAFYGCSGLTNIEIPNSVTSIGNAAFWNCSSLTSIEIPNSVTSIGFSAFAYCSGLTNFAICDGVKTVEEYAFYNCSNLETLYIGNTIESIGDDAFLGCDKIKEIKVGLKKPISGSENIFANDTYYNATLYVPNGTKSLYEKREPWNLFLYIAEMDFTGIDEVFDELEGEDGKVEGVYYDLNGRVVENPVNGIYILNGKNVFIK